MTGTAVRKEDIVKLREKTGAGFMECKGALQEAKGKLERAVDILRKKGVLLAQKKSGRAVREGVVHAYIHAGSRVGVLIEVGCETDFVARNEDFQAFVKDVAMQVAAVRPKYVSHDQVPAEALDREKDIYRAQIKDKPAPVIEKIMEGKLKKFYEESCLLDQPFIKRPEVSIQAYLTETIAKLGENMVIRRFTRYELGEDTEQNA